MLREIDLHEFGENQRSRDAPFPPQPLELALQSVRRIPLRRESSTLQSLRVSTANAIPVCPLWLPVPTRPLQPDDLTLLRHHVHPLRRKKRGDRAASTQHRRADAHARSASTPSPRRWVSTATPPH